MDSEREKSLATRRDIQNFRVRFTTLSEAELVPLEEILQLLSLFPGQTLEVEDLLIRSLHWSDEYWESIDSNPRTARQYILVTAEHQRHEFGRTLNKFDIVLTPAFLYEVTQHGGTSFNAGFVVNGLDRMYPESEQNVFQFLPETIFARLAQTLVANTETLFAHNAK